MDKLIRYIKSHGHTVDSFDIMCQTITVVAVFSDGSTQLETIDATYQDVRNWLGY